MVVRVAVCSVLAAAVTLGLFTLMRTLVEMSEVSLDEYGKRKVIEFVRLKRESATEVRKRELPKRQQTKRPPKAPPVSRSNTTGPAAGAVAVMAPTTKATVDLKGALKLGTAPADTGAVPVVRVQPIYPQHARRRGIEGWVVVQFDVDESGKVVNVKVLDAKPKGVFDSAAKQTIRRWKYKPKIAGGKPTADRNKKKKLVFQLND